MFFAVSQIIECGPPSKEHPDFNGVGDFKINKTVIKDIDTVKYKYTEKSVRINIDSAQWSRLPNMAYPWELLCEGVRDIDMEEFDINDIIFTNVSLIFYHDTLIYFNADVSPSLEDVLKSKYPNYNKNNATGKLAYVWYNQTITAATTPGVFSGQIFYIEDTKKYEQIKKEAKEKEKEYVKKKNSAI